MYKLKLLFRSKNETVLLNLSKFIFHAMRIRTTLLNMFFILSFCMDTFLFLVVVLHRSTNWIYTIM